MAFTLNVSRKQTNLTTTNWAAIATSTDSNKHIVITKGWDFNEGSAAEIAWLRFDESSSSAQAKIVIGGVAGAGNDVLTGIVGDLGKDIQAKLESSGDVEVFCQYIEVTPFEAAELMKRGR